MTMRLLMAAACLPFVLGAQNCAPAGAMAPSGAIAAVLDDSNCRWADGTLWAAWTLVLPARGVIQLDVVSGEVTLLLRDAAGGLLDSGASIRRPIERGVYAVVASARVAGQSPSYSIRSVFTPEPGTWCRGFASIGLNQQRSDVLGGSGCRAPNNLPYEAYALHTPGSGTLDVTVDSGAFTPVVILRGDDGRALAPGGAGLSWAVDGDSDYTLVVEGDKGGGYQIATAFTPSADETCRAQATFTASSQHSGVIGSRSCTSSVNSNGDALYFNYYEFEVSDAGTAELRASSSVFDPILYLFNGSGDRIATDRLGGGKGRSAVRLQLPPGKYSVWLLSAQPAGGAYTFEYTFSPGPPPACDPLSHVPGDTSEGSLGSASCRTSLGQSDIYSVALPADGTLELTMNSGDFSPVLAIRDLRDNTIVWDDTAAGLAASHLLADLPAGSYMVVGAAVAGAGRYQLSSKFTAHALSPCPAPQVVPPNTGYIQALGASPCRGANGQPVDTYEFTLPSDGTIAAVLTSASIDGYLTLTTASGEYLRSDDNTYGYGDPLLVQFLPAGTYRLSARAAQNSFGGLYRVDVLFQAGERSPGCAPRGTLTPGIPASGNLNYAGCQYPDDTFADVYSFSLTDGAAVDIRLDSVDFNAALVLLDDAGNVVEAADDGGDDGNARIRRTLAPGTYYVVTKPSSDYASNGDYTLSLVLP